MIKLFLATGIMAFFFVGCFQLREGNLGNSQNKRILILGNSITYHAPKPSIGWKGDWGMAASSEEKDYVHLLIEKFKGKNKQSQIKYANIVSSFEGRFWLPDWQGLKEFREYEPDVLIVRLGDNVNLDSLGKYRLSEALKDLVDYVAADKKVDVFISSTFWPNPRVNEQIRNVSEENSWNYVELTSIPAAQETMAIGKFSNNAVAIHPSDIGMSRIADALWAVLKERL